MIKKLVILIIPLIFIFISCSKDTDDEIKEETKPKITTSYKDTEANNKKIIFSGKTLSSSNKYASVGNLIFFPDPNSNNKLSVSEIPSTSNKITSDSVIDIFDYNVNCITSVDNTIYFSSIHPEKGLYKLNYEKKEITKLNNDSSSHLLYKNENLYYINSNDNKLYCYKIKENKTYLLLNSKINNFILNNDSIFYTNNDDNSKLYCLKIDENYNFKMIDYPIESFVILNNKILFSNLNDNNKLYSLDISTLETKRVLNLSLSNLKQNEENIYFINNEDSNLLYSLLPNDDNTDFTYTKLFDNCINEYYITDIGIFIEPASNLNTIIYIKSN